MCIKMVMESMSPTDSGSCPNIIPDKKKWDLVWNSFHISAALHLPLNCLLAGEQARNTGE